MKFVSIASSNELYATCVVCLGALLSGVDMTFSADLTSHVRDMTITIHEQSLIGSINQYASAIGSLWITYFLNILGRKNSLLFILLCYTVAWILMSFCSFSMAVIYVSRAFSGFAAGMKAPYVVYITETVNKGRRGILISLLGLSISLGIAITYVIQYFASWYTVALVSLIISVVVSIQTYFLKETKYWLLHQKNVEKAKESMKWFDNSLTEAEIQSEIDEILSSDNQLKDCRTNILASFKDRNNLRCFMFGFLLLTFLYGCGRVQITALPDNYYSQFQLPVSKSVIRLIQGILEVAMSVVFSLVVDRAPRKTILHLCSWLMNACLVIALFNRDLINFCGWIGEWATLVALMLFYGLACGFLMCITTIMAAEIGSVTTEARGIFQGLLYVWINFISGVYNEVFPFALQAIPINYIILFFFMNLALLSCTGYFAPETRGVAIHHCSTQKRQTLNELVESPFEIIY